MDLALPSARTNHLFFCLTYPGSVSEERGWNGFPFTFQMRLGRGMPRVSHSNSRESPAPTCNSILTSVSRYNSRESPAPTCNSNFNQCLTLQQQGVSSPYLQQQF